jgi:hypothetical protein
MEGLSLSNVPIHAQKTSTGSASDQQVIEKIGIGAEAHDPVVAVPGLRLGGIIGRQLRLSALPMTTSTRPFH